VRRRCVAYRRRECLPPARGPDPFDVSVRDGVELGDRPARLRRGARVAEAPAMKRTSRPNTF
jgi:hypothetical protein